MKYSPLLLALLALPAFAGPQSNNFGIQVVPAPGKVVVDGSLDDWDETGRLQIFADWDLRERYSAELSAMWDKDFLYIAVRRKDPTPMQNTVDPRFNPNDGWKSDALQLRFRTDRTVWFTCWFFTPKKQPVAHFEYEKIPGTPGGGKVIVCDDPPPKVGNGVELAYRMDADGKGYVEEMKIPWELLYEKKPGFFAPGMKFRLGVETIWGDPNNPGWPQHRYADNIQPDNTGRQFFWKNVKGWGDATLMAQGAAKRSDFQYNPELQQGAFPVRANLPAGSKSFTLVLRDEAGNIVRNLAGGFPVDAYRTGGSANAPVVSVNWDGLDDKGNLVAPGRYQLSGIALPGLSATLDACFYNPGHPPWGNLAGTGAWGADHHAPRWVKRSGNWMILGWDFAEGGSGIIGVDPSGRKQWGENRGAGILAADEKYVYAVINSWYGGGRLCRFDARTGKPAPFVMEGKERQFELPVTELAGEFMPPALPQAKGRKMTMAEIAPASAMASNGKIVALALLRGDLMLLDAASAVRIKMLPVKDVTALSFAPDGTLWGIVGAKPGEIALADGKFIPLNAECGKVVDIDVNAAGEIALLDAGADSQFKIFDRAGKLLRTAGKKGGRAWSGVFEPQAIMMPSSGAWDARGNLWTTENWDAPRRVSVWGKDGKLVRDYVGNTGYAGTGSYLDENVPDYAYVGPVEMKIDRKTHTYSVTRILWNPDPAKNQAFPLYCTTPHWFSNASFMRSSASGKPINYLFFYDRYRAVYMPFGDRYQPVAAIGHMEDLPLDIRTRLFPAADSKDGFYWNDLNFDGAIQPAEVELVKGGHGYKRSMTDWGNRLGDKLDMYVNGLLRYDPIGFAPNGAPLYGPAGKRALGIKDHGDLVPVPGSDTLLCLSFDGFPNRTNGMSGVDRNTGKRLWSYPSLYPSVHGSHRAPMARPGLLIGPLKIAGTAWVNAEVGHVFMVRGNLGEDYYFTVDGYYIGKLFQDSRLPGDGLPEVENYSVPLDGVSGGGEPFCGWFGRMADGRILQTIAIVRQAGTTAEIKGFDQIRRLKPEIIALTPEALEVCKRDNIVRAAAAEATQTIKVGKMEKNNYALLPANEVRQIGNPTSGTVKMGYDANFLYLQYVVRDASPMLNSGNDYRKLFKTGDAVDLMLEPTPGRPIRLLFSLFEGKPVAVLTELKKENANPEFKYTYHSPVMNYPVDRVEILKSAAVSVKKESDRYTLTAKIPLAELGLKVEPGMALPGDLGIIASDVAGMTNTARIYRFNIDTNLLNDLPGEAQLNPKKWGKIEFAK